MLDHSKITKRHFWMIQRAQKEVSGHLMELGLLDDLILHIVIVLNVFQHKATLSGHDNYSKIQKVGFGHFLGFGLLDQLDIAYCGSTKCFPTSGKVTRSWRTIQKSRKCIFGWSKEPKKKFLAIFWSLVCWIDLILHIMIVLNVFQHLGVVTGHA